MVGISVVNAAMGTYCRVTNVVTTCGEKKEEFRGDQDRGNGGPNLAEVTEICAEIRANLRMIKELILQRNMQRTISTEMNLMVGPLSGETKDGGLVEGKNYWSLADCNEMENVVSGM